MASEKKTSKNAAYDRLRAALKAQTTARAYLFYGEESYLRQTYVQQLQTLLIPKGSEDFNLHRLSGPRLTAQEVADAVEAMPMMAANTLVTVTDWDIFKLEEAQRSQLIELLEDIPEYCTLLFIYDTVAYKRDGKMKMWRWWSFRASPGTRWFGGCKSAFGPWTTKSTSPPRTICSFTAAP